MRIKSLEDYVYSKHGVYGKGHEFEASELEYERLKALNFKMEVLEGDVEEEEEVVVETPPDPPEEPEIVEPNKTDGEKLEENKESVATQNMLSFNEIQLKLKLNGKVLADLIKENNIEKVDGKYDVALIESVLNQGKEEGTEEK